MKDHLKQETNWFFEVKMKDHIKENISYGEKFYTSTLYTLINNEIKWKVANLD
jgi:hypothetical protein